MPRVSGYQYSYSGADCKIFAYIPDSNKIHLLESMNTISISVHEAKGQARALGHRGIKGVSRGIRTIAGSMILTVIEDHPLRDLLVEASETRDVWSIDRNDTGVGAFNDKVTFDNRIETLLPRFNILAMYVSEMGGHVDSGSVNSAGWELKGVHITDVGLVTSVHDIVSEITISFIAEDYYPFSLSDLSGAESPPEPEVPTDETQETILVPTPEGLSPKDEWKPDEAQARDDELRRAALQNLQGSVWTTE